MTFYYAENDGISIFNLGKDSFECILIYSKRLNERTFAISNKKNNMKSRE